jgi:hypothetical protein
MKGRNLALGGTLALVVALALLTVDVMIRDGIDVLVVLSFLIVGMVGFGVLGALFNPPEK